MKYLDRYVGFLIGALLVIVFNGCDGSDNYRVFVYPDRNDLTVHREFGPYDLEKEARAVVGKEMVKYPDGDYEIGKNCERRDDTTLWVCESTFR